MRPEDTELADPSAHKLAKVKTLLPYRQIVEMLRKAADDIEAGDFGEAEDAVFILQSSRGVNVFGWGKALMPNSIGLIELGKPHPPLPRRQVPHRRLGAGVLPAAQGLRRAVRRRGIVPAVQGAMPDRGLQRYGLARRDPVPGAA
jgi:hypothetical protein